ncbi:MAG: thioredoxin [Methanoregulaceae archaeon]
MDDDLAQIREKRMQEMQEQREQKKSAGVIPITGQNFSEVLAGSERLVIDFWAEWCGPCRRVGPIVEELSREFAGTITFAKCNTDENQNIAMQYGISAIPTIILYSRGKMVGQIIGAYPKDAFRDQIKKAFGLS